MARHLWGEQLLNLGQSYLLSLSSSSSFSLSLSSSSSAFSLSSLLSSSSSSAKETGQMGRRLWGEQLLNLGQSGKKWAN